MQAGAGVRVCMQVCVTCGLLLLGSDRLLGGRLGAGLGGSVRRHGDGHLVHTGQGCGGKRDLIQHRRGNKAAGGVSALQGIGPGSPPGTYLQSGLLFASSFSVFFFGLAFTAFFL